MSLAPFKACSFILNAFRCSLVVLITAAFPTFCAAAGEVLEVYCPSSGHRERLIQGSSALEESQDIQNIAVVCERTGQIRSIKVPIDPTKPVKGNHLIARRHGTARSEFLDFNLPKFPAPGNTCPLFPIVSYLQENICLLDGRPGGEFAIVGEF
jgi:hypothetical protein